MADEWAVPSVSDEEITQIRSYLIRHPEYYKHFQKLSTERELPMEYLTYLLAVSAKIGFLLMTDEARDQLAMEGKEDEHIEFVRLMGDINIDL